MLGHYRKYAALIGMMVLAGCTVAAKSRVDDAKLAVSQPETALALQADESFGKGLSKQEIKELSAAEIKALEFGKSGEKINWKGDRASVSGSVIAFQLYRVGQSNCRRFEHQLLDVKDKKQTSGTACKRGAQTWKLVE